MKCPHATRPGPELPRRRRLGAMIPAVMTAVMGFAQDPAPMAEAVRSAADGNGFMGSVLVANGDQVVFERSAGLANVEWNIPNAATTKFRIGSLTKQFTAAAVLLLQERGKLQLDEPVAGYLDEVPAAWRPITVRQLLDHTAGVPDILAVPKRDQNAWELSGFAPGTLLERMRDLPLDFEPGTKFQYSNTGYFVLGWMVERLSGQTYRDFVKQNLLDPLGLVDSGYDSSIAILPRRASGYEVGDRGLRIRNANYIDMRGPGAAGGLYSTTGDLLKWTRALFGGKVLQPDSLASMTTPAKGGYALGFQIGSKNGRRRIAHGGGINGFGSFLAYFPASDVTIVVLANVGGPAAARLEERLEQIYFGE